MRLPRWMLANVYRPGTALANYWVSEKYDSVRGYWDGAKLMTRGGEPIAAPAWFTAGWPAAPMDGELWTGRGQFSKAVSTVHLKTLDDAAWRKLQFMVFDLPVQGGTFTQRIPPLEKLVAPISQPWVKAVVQLQVADQPALQPLLTKTVNSGGEGLMLHQRACRCLCSGQRQIRRQAWGAAGRDASSQRQPGAALQTVHRFF